MQIKLPRQFDYKSALQFTNTIATFADETVVEVDFTHVGFVFPLGTLLIGREIRHLVTERYKRGLKTQASGMNFSHAAHSYLKHIGFFSYIGLKNVTGTDQESGGITYIPIRRLTRSYLMELAGGDSKKFHGVVLKKSNELGRLMVGYSDDQGYNAISYCFKEIIRNVFEHSGAGKCHILGQKWSNGAVEVAIVDEGHGIKKSLSEVFDVKDDSEALKMAIRPGITRTINLTDDQNTFGNSGFGLYVLSELGRSFGRFALGSGRAAISLNSKPMKESVIDFHGTFVGIRFNSKPQNFLAVLDDIVAAGEAEAEAEGRCSPASSESKSESLKP